MDRDPTITVSEAIKEHSKWMENINKCLICDIAPEEQMLADEPHLKCKFGKWLENYKDELQEINLQLFYEVYEEHKNLHLKAKEILDIAYEDNFMNVIKHKTIPLIEYEELLKLSKDIKKTLRKFRAKLYDD